MGETNKAILVSPELEIFDWSCLRLVYQIAGAGSLQVHLRPDGENFDYLLWTMDKPSDSWLIGSVDLRKISSAYQVPANMDLAEKGKKKFSQWKCLVKWCHWITLSQVLAFEKETKDLLNKLF